MSCAACFTGSPQPGTPRGTYSTLHGYTTYTVQPRHNPRPSGSTILYLPDFFSHKLINNQLLCDAYADATGCTVIFPDIVMWGGVAPAYMPAFEVLFGEEPAAWWKKLWSVLTLLPLLPQLVFGMPDRAFPAVVGYARAVRKGLPKGAKLGVAGFCWGGYGATKLCSEVREEGVGRLVDACFTGHPSKIEVGDVLDAVSSGVPYSVAVAEIDFMFDQKKAEEAEAAVRGRFGASGNDGRVWELRVHEGACHGFCVRAKEGVEADQRGREEGLKQAVEWFSRFLL